MFLNELKFIQITPAAYVGAADLIAAFGEDAEDAGETFKTVLCGWDNIERTVKRGLKLGETAQPSEFTNGNFGFIGLPTQSAFDAWTAGLILGVTEITEAQFMALMPEPGI